MVAAVALLAGIVALRFQPLEPVSNAILDAQFGISRYVAPAGDRMMPFIIGIDEATYAAYPEPFALWHPHFAELLRALVVHRPAVVAFDVALPTKDFSAFGSDGPYDASLIAAIAEFRRQLPRTLLVFTAAVDGDPGGWRLVLPDRRLLAPLRPDELSHFAHPFIHADGDGRLRRIRHFDTPMPSLAGAVAAHLGHEVEEGLIDYRIGWRMNYLGMRDFLSDYDHRNAMLAGRIVLVGDVTPFGDRVSLPVRLSTWMYDSRELPGVLAHAQIIRMLDSDATLRPLGTAGQVSLVAAAAAVALAVMGPVAAILVFILLAGGVLTASTMALHAGVVWDAVPVILALGIGMGGRQVVLARQAIAQRRQLRTLFGGYVSPPVMRGILDGRIQPGIEGMRREVAVLFSDVRGFTTRSEKADPERIIALLNRYFDAMVPIVHRHGGMVDKFIGDGLMVLFGAPEPRPDPAGDAVVAAREMLDALSRLNAEFAAEGEQELRVGIGIHVGPAVIGHVGSRARHEYTAIGDTVNLAARLESMTKALGHAIVFSGEVAARIEGRHRTRSLGLHDIKGREAVVVYALDDDAAREA